MRVALANLVSLSAILLFLLPWGFFVATNKMVFLWLGVVTSLADGSTKIWKHLFGTESVFGRPLGACDCDILCRNGDQSGRRGFPSGHMTTTSVVCTTLALMHGDVGLSLGAAVTIGLMGWARYIKRCHNLVQIVAGTIYGFFVATFFVAFSSFSTT